MRGCIRNKASYSTEGGKLTSLTSNSSVSSMPTKLMACHVGELRKAGSGPVASFLHGNTQYRSRSHIEANTLTGCLQTAPCGGTL